MKAFIGINMLGTTVDADVKAVRAEPLRLHTGSLVTPSSPAHLTLIPPVEIREDQLGATRFAIKRVAYERLRGVVTLRCKGLGTLQHSGLTYLVVKFEDNKVLDDLRDNLAQAMTLLGFNYPLLSESWVPHVTIGHTDSTEPVSVNVESSRLNAEVTLRPDMVFLPYKDKSEWHW